MLLEIKDLDAYYGEVQVLKDISLEVTEGELVTIIGANAAGKSTLLKAISGVIPAVKGKVKFNDLDVTLVPPHKRVEMGIVHVPEGRRLFPEMSVMENLELGCYSKAARPYKDETLQWVFQILPLLKERKDQLAGSLSGGQQQLCAIGRGLMSRPKLLMLDEPTLGLAPLMVKAIFEIVHGIRKHGTSVLLVEQNAMRALDIADRGYVLENGCVILEGRSNELLGNEQVKKAYLGL
ncbi:MAG: ABC transporter ATP-binding protein [Desulfitobacteriaceae bacterium]